MKLIANGFVGLILLCVLHFSQGVAYSQTQTVLGTAAVDELETDQSKSTRASLLGLCEKQFANSCRNLGIMWENGVEGEASLTQAEAFYKKSCILNDRKGCTDLARLFVHHRNDLETRKRGITMLGKNCDLNDYRACMILGNTSFLAGLYENAEYLLNRACEEGREANACFNLGLTHERKKNSDLEKSRTYYGKACELGLQTACKQTR